MQYEFSGQMSSARVILYHKQSTSAMTRFFKLNDGGVLIGGEIPKLARVITGEVKDDPSVVSHPAAIVAELAAWLGLSVDAFEVETEYAELLEVPGELIRMNLIRFTTIDPPFAEAEQVGASFIALTQARGLESVELELLRSAYTMIMEG